jgi:riboflavin biosynthesis pyrimidine reductase
MTQSGEVFFHNGKLRRFFSDAPEKAFVASSKTITSWPDGVRQLANDPGELLRTLRQVHGVSNLVIEGGSEINAIFLMADLVDELFLTLAPKIKLGSDVPTYAGGNPLPRTKLMDFRMESCVPIGDEVFLRYRRS